MIRYVLQCFAMFCMSLHAVVELLFPCCHLDTGRVRYLSHSICDISHMARMLARTRALRARILTSSYLELPATPPKKTARRAKLFAKSQKLFLHPALARRAGMAREEKSEGPTLCSFALGSCCASARCCEARTPRELSITSQIQRTFQSYSWVIPAPDCAVC